MCPIESGSSPEAPGEQASSSLLICSGPALEPIEALARPASILTLGTQVLCAYCRCERLCCRKHLRSQKVLSADSVLRSASPELAPEYKSRAVLSPRSKSCCRLCANSLERSLKYEPGKDLHTSCRRLLAATSWDCSSVTALPLDELQPIVSPGRGPQRQQAFVHLPC